MAEPALNPPPVPAQQPPIPPGWRRYTIEIPDGRKMTIDASDEATALRGAQEWYGGRSTPQSATEKPLQLFEVEIDGRLYEAEAPDARAAAAAVRKGVERGLFGGPAAAQAPARAPAPFQPNHGGPQIPGADYGASRHRGRSRTAVEEAAAPILDTFFGGREGPERALQLAGQDTARIASDFAGAPVDLTTLAVNTGLTGADLVASLFGGRVDARVREPVLGSDWLNERVKQGAEFAGADWIDDAERTEDERLLGNLNRYGGGAMTGAAALARVPARAAETAIGRAIQILARPYQESRGRALYGDAAAGAGAGTALNEYNEDVPESVRERLGPAGEAIAMLLGGAGGATLHSVASGASRAGANAVRGVLVGRGDPNAPLNTETGRRFTRGEMDLAARDVQSHAVNPEVARRNLVDTRNDLSEFASPGQLPTVAPLSGDPGLALLERSYRASDGAPFIERDRAVTSRAGEIVGSTAPRSAVSRDFTDHAGTVDRNRVDAAQREVDRLTAAARAGAADQRSAVVAVDAYEGQRAPASAALDRGIVDESLRPLQDRKNRAFEAIDPGREVVIDAAPLIEAAGQVRSTLGRLNDPATVLPVDTLNRIEALAPAAGGEGTITFGELNALRPQLSAGITKAQQAGDYMLADNIRRLQQAIDAETTRLASEASPAGERAAEASRAYQREFAPVWNPGPGDAATEFRKRFNLDRQGRSTTPPSQTAGQFLQPGQPEKAESLRRIIASTQNPQAAQSEVRRYLMADLAESGALDRRSGTLRPDTLRKWRGQWGAALDLAPGFRSEIDDMLARAQAGERLSGQLANDVERATRSLSDVQQNKGALGFVLGKDPVRAVQSVFSSGDPERNMQEIVRTIGGNEAASDGLKATIRDYLLERATTSAVQRTADRARPVDFGRLDDLFARNERALAAAHSPNGMNALRQAHKLLRPMNDLKASGAAGGAANGSAERNWRLLEGALKARYGVLKGGGILRTIRIFVAALPDSREAASRIVARMWFDPELALHLLGRDVDPGGPVWNSKLNKLLAATEAGRESGRE